VKKKTGGIRVLIGYRLLNKGRKENIHPLLLLADIKRLVNKANYFTTIDLKAVFNQIKKKERQQRENNSPN
jgi:hypothetical protein